jgi:hypothetical protein
MPEKKQKGKGKTTSNKAVRRNSVPEAPTQAQSSKRQRSASVQEVPDEEPTHRGQVLDNDADAIIEEVGSQAADGNEPIHITDSESEDDETKLREQSQTSSYHATS